MKIIAKTYQLKLALAAAFFGLLFTGCKEEIDTSARFTLTEYTVLSYLESDSIFSEYVKLIHQVPVSSQSESTVAQLLSARGKYTCFAPDNQAIQDYLDTLQAKGIISEANWDAFQGHPATLDSVRKIIVLNSIIDGSRNGDLYEISDIEDKEELDELPTANLNDRKIYHTKIKQTDSIFINGVALIDLNNRDIETINGRVHQVHAVIAPSNDTMSDIFRQGIAENKHGFLVASKLILAAGLEDTLSKTRDEVWERLYMTKQIKDLENHPTEPDQPGTMPEHRKYGFTIFAETDDMWETALGKPAEAITVEDVKAFLIEKGAYPGASTDENYKDENNIIYQFITYHILPEKLTRDKLVIHYNEKGYYWQTNGKRYTIPVYEYYTTMGKRRVLKIFESADREGIYLNCFPILRNGRGKYSPEQLNVDDYHESGSYRKLSAGNGQLALFPFDPSAPADMPTDENVGIKINYETEEGANHESLINGCIYPINGFLVYTDNVRNCLAGERIRIDMAAMFPEFINNDIRRPMSYYSYGASFTRAVPVTTTYPYLADCQIEEGTKFYYFGAFGRSWSNYQMDEFNIIGKYEITMRLPPVPTKGHYEIRFGVSAGSNVRSMCQVYFGDNPKYLPAAGIPMDLRMGFMRNRFSAGTHLNSNFGYFSEDDYKAELKLSLEEQDEITKSLRARGFMKGPKYYHCGASTSASLGIECEWVTRRIMVSADMDPDKTYYIRFKNVLNNEQLQFFTDYLEFVSKDVYDNPNEPEDYW